VVGLPSQWLVIPVASLVAIAVLAWRRRLRDLLLAAGTALAVLAGSWIAIGNVLGAAYIYIVRFSWAVGFFVAVIIVWGAVVLVQPLVQPLVEPWLTRPAVRRVGPIAVTVALALVFVALAVPTLWQGRDDELPDEHDSRSLATIIDPVDAWALANNVGTVSVIPGISCTPPASGVALELQRRGLRVRVEGILVRVWPSEHQADEQPSDARITLICGPQAIANRTRLTPGELVVTYTPTAEDQADKVLPVAAFASAP
jgi:MFS family permease